MFASVDEITRENGRGVAIREAAPVAALSGSYDSVRDAYLLEMGKTWIKKRPFVVIPAMALQFYFLWMSDYPRMRLAVLATAHLLLDALIIKQAIRIRQAKAFDQAAVFSSSAVVIFVHTLGLAMTGGLRSPLLPTLLASTMIALVSYGRRLETGILLGLAAAVFLGLAIGPAAWFGPTVTEPWFTVSLTTSLLAFVFITGPAMAALMDTYVASGRTVARMRSDLVALHEQRARSMEALSARVAHDIKNPLAAIAGLSQLLLKNETDERARERLLVIVQETERMERILKDYLTFSKPLIDLAPSPTRLDRAIEHVVFALEGKAHQSGVQVFLELGPVEGVVDGPRIEDALLNLVGNAIEATPRGGRVDVQLTRSGPDLTIRVRDTGRGMPTDVLERIGTPFFTTRADGTGLGVAIARSVAKAHGGNLSYESDVGKGTSAILSLPVHGRECRKGPSESLPCVRPRKEAAE